MNIFSRRFSFGGFGGALGMLLYSLIVSALLFGKVPPVKALAAQAISVWLFFGLIFALVHIKRSPTLVSSLLSSLVFVVAVSLLSGLAAVNAVNLLVIAVLLFLTLLIGTGAFLAFAKATRSAVIAFAVMILLGLL